MTEAEHGADPINQTGDHAASPLADVASADAAPAAVPQDEAAEVAPPAPEPRIAEPTADTPPLPAASARQAFGQGMGSMRGDVQERLVAAAEDAKGRAGDALQSLAQMLFDAADQVDERIGSTYGDHVRHAGTAVEDFASEVRQKELDAFAADVRGFIARSPATAVGVAATLGFALARVVHAGVEQRA